MYKRHKHDIIVIISLIGFGISLYLTIYHYLGYVIPCNVTHGCETVLASKYSEVFGIPLSLLGMGYFTAVIFASLLANHYAQWQRLLSWLLGIGAVIALVLLGIQFFIIKKVCQYCFVTDTLSILIFLWDLNIAHQKV